MEYNTLPLSETAVGNKMCGIICHLGSALLSNNYSMVSLQYNISTQCKRNVPWRSKAKLSCSYSVIGLSLASSTPLPPIPLKNKILLTTVNNHMQSTCIQGEFGRLIILTKSWYPKSHTNVDITTFSLQKLADNIQIRSTKNTLVMTKWSRQISWSPITNCNTNLRSTLW